MGADTRFGAQLQEAAMLLRRGHHGAAFENVVAVRLLDIYILARLEGVNCRQGLPMIDRADHHCIERFVLQRLPKILNLFWPFFLPWPCMQFYNLTR